MSLAGDQPRPNRLPGPPAPSRYIVAASIATVAAAMFLTAPRAGEFWWSDAPRHALNVLFLHDFLTDLPLSAPRAWAVQYYTQFPALTILFYPPLFYGLAVPFVAAFGESHASIQAAVAAHHAVLGWGAFALARRWFDWPVALGSAVVTMAMPEVALWGRQVMLEVPSAAFLIWSLVWWLRYLDSPSTCRLVLALVMALAATYTRLTAGFVFPVFALHLLVCGAWRSVRKGPVVAAGMGVAVALLPLVWLTLEFGRPNLESTLGIADSAVSRASVAGWLWYARRLPSQLTPGLAALAVVSVASVCLRPALRATTRRDAWLLGLYFGVGYLFFSAIDLKEARLTVYLLLAVPPVAASLLMALPSSSARSTVALAGSVLFAAFVLATHPVPGVVGYAAAAARVAADVPPGGRVMFSGQRDGAFIFNLRVLRPARDITVARSDKLLLDVVVRRELGVRERDYSEAEISALIHQYGLRTVVAQRDFWTDLTPMARLQHVLEGADFALVPE
jgi:hypothetical protein